MSKEDPIALLEDLIASAEMVPVLRPTRIKDAIREIETLEARCQRYREAIEDLLDGILEEHPVFAQRCDCEMCKARLIAQDALKDGD